ncbi:hypothetical protein HPULCUR_001736 [Helicostylum pulchrum]|uniref:Uncharacterized protein n=1 Tax=Helicostylum pulchrum TaxID=562976 RepID=A0ABP9XNI4_9FUNG
MSEENEPTHYMSREEVQDNPTQEEKNNDIQSDIIKIDAMKESLQISITSEENFSNTPCQQVQLQEDHVYFSPKVHQAPPITEKNMSPKMKVQKRTKRRTIITDPKDLRRSPRLALKKRVQYFPIKITRRTRKNIALS